MLQIDKVDESDDGNLTYYVFTIKDAILRIYGDGEKNIQKIELE